MKKKMRLRLAFANIAIAVVMALANEALSLALGDDFDPSVQTDCLDGKMQISLETKLPFSGVIYAAERRSLCGTVGNGSLATQIDVPLTEFDRCGVSYNPETEEYSVLITVREHPLIILKQDRTFNISCPGAAKRTQANDSFIVSTRKQRATVSLGLYSVDDNKIHHAWFGHSYELRVRASVNFVVTSCFGFAGQNDSVQLSDSHGCTVDPQMMTNFEYDRKLNVGRPVNARAKLMSMFKFSSTKLVHLQCSVQLCPAYGCTRVDCERRRDDPFPEESRAQPVATNTENRYFASTTVQVSESNRPARRDDLSGGDTGSATSVLGRCTSDHHVLSALCILFACLFLAAVGVNFLFCALAGYCCCGKGNKPMQSASLNRSLVANYVDAATLDRIVRSRTGETMSDSNGLVYGPANFAPNSMDGQKRVRSPAAANLHSYMGSASKMAQRCQQNHMESGCHKPYTINQTHMLQDSQSSPSGSSGSGYLSDKPLVTRDNAKESQRESSATHFSAGNSSSRDLVSCRNPGYLPDKAARVRSTSQTCLTELTRNSMDQRGLQRPRLRDQLYEKAHRTRHNNNNNNNNNTQQPQQHHQQHLVRGRQNKRNSVAESGLKLSGKTSSLTQYLETDNLPPPPRSFLFPPLAKPDRHVPPV